jgi:hypothetical protein
MSKQDGDFPKVIGGLFRAESMLYVGSVVVPIQAKAFEVL